MKTPFFSVIVPTLNEEKYLPNILNSLVKQTYRNFELVVVDGRSEDRTKEVFDQIQKEIPHACFFSTKKRNVAHQRNLGVRKASGDYLVFFDADSNIAATFLEEIHVLILKKKLKFVTTWVEPDSKKKIDKLVSLLSNLEMEVAKVINKPFAPGFNTIVRRDVFLKLHGFRENLAIGEDHDFTLRALEKKIELTILQEPRVVWSLRRFRSQGLMKVLGMYTEANLHMLLNGPIADGGVFTYPMGGHVHQAKKKKKVNLARIDTYLKDIDKLEKTFRKILNE